MIVNDNLEFHNVAALEAAPGFNAPILPRLPAELRHRLNPRARFVAMESVGAEIRFVCAAPNLRVHLSCLKPEFNERLDVKIYKGNFECQAAQLVPGVITTLFINPPPNMDKVKPQWLRTKGFSPDVWRIAFGRGIGVFCGLDTFGAEYRPPRPDEKPAVTWLAYGSSITNSHLDGYPHVAARRLGVDVINLGLSGACQCEKEIVDWMTSRQDWDIATLELGINMIGGFTPEEFRARAEYLIRTFAESHPAKPVVLITLFPSLERAEIANSAGVNQERDEAFCRIIREIHRELNRPNLHLIEGGDILDDVNGLGADLLHPNIFGHAVMGMNLAERLRRLIAE